MRHYTVDLDCFKPIARHVRIILWRVSSSGLGFHYWWTCPRKSCKACKEVQRALDDRGRQRMEKKRAPQRQGVLYSTKGIKRAGPWFAVRLPKSSTNVLST